MLTSKYKKLKRIGSSGDLFATNIFQHHHFMSQPLFDRTNSQISQLANKGTLSGEVEQDDFLSFLSSKGVVLRRNGDKMQFHSMFFYLDNISIIVLLFYIYLVV
jgi:hypothetical protein